MGDVKKAIAIGAVLLMGSVLSAHAGYVVTVQEQGSDVVASGGGTIDLTGLTFIENDHVFAAVTPGNGIISTGGVGSNAVSIYSGITGPASFGSGFQSNGSSGSGDQVGICDFCGGNIWVPEGYTSENSLTDTTTYANQTLAGLGATPGVYEWTWGTGADQNFTIDIVAPETAAPEPGSMALLASFAGGLAAFRRRRRK